MLKTQIFVIRLTQL